MQALTSFGVPPDAAKGLDGVQQIIRAGDLEVESHDFEDILGKLLTPLPEAVREVLA